jgi:hypothetical protein
LAFYWEIDFWIVSSCGMAGSSNLSLEIFTISMGFFLGKASSLRWIEFYFKIDLLVTRILVLLILFGETDLFTWED